MRKRIALLGCVAIVSLVFANGLPAASEPVTVFLVRHAEKATDDPDDPGLSEAGRARAAALARVLGHVGVTHAYVTQFRRTRQTLEPLAEAKGVEIHTLRAQDPQAQLSALRALPPGAVAVVAGHSNTIPQLVCALGGRPPDLDCTQEAPQIDEREYDRLYLMLLPSPTKEAPLGTLSLRYGD